ncbi:hypothetical protein [Actinotalea ferrariae]|uniref:hypothetical protein n=1 Tax=Actinotalea ferrariae TaxID=1386098 RepID=UPI001C8B9D30|nr:hypothetical protein [Actinotalea ferrariae]
MREVATKAAPTTFTGAYAVLHATSLFVAWCMERDEPLDIETLFTEANVEHFVSTGMPHLQSHSRNSYRAALRRTGRAATRHALWSPAPQALGRRSLRAPYTHQEIDWLWEIARSQPSIGRRRAARALMALGYGAGLSLAEIVVFPGCQIKVSEAGVLVEVTGERARIVPALPEAHADLIAMRADHYDATVLADVRPSRTAGAGVVANLVVPEGAPRFDSVRLRTTWMVTLLVRGARLSEVTALAGITSTKNFQDIIDFVPRRSLEEIATVLAGGAS